MDDAGKIALGLIGAAVIVAMTSIGYREYERQRDIAEATQIMQTIAQPWQQSIRIPDPEAVRLEVQAREVQDMRRAADLAERQRRSLLLNADERCIGGTIIQVIGSTYTQVSGPGGRPAACAGAYRTP